MNEIARYCIDAATARTSAVVRSAGMMLRWPKHPRQREGQLNCTVTEWPTVVTWAITGWSRACS
jgi:hypothetical protein